MSKAMGTIPADYALDEPVLRIGGESAEDLVAQAGGTPLFVYDLAIVRNRIARFRLAFPGIRLHYAVKANPFRPLLRSLNGLVDGFDIASEGELGLALEADIDPRSISFAGPGKREAELAAAIGLGVTVNCESETEVERALAIGRQRSVRPRLAVRVNPPFEIRGSAMRMGGGARPFGIDADRVPAVVRSIVEAGAEWRGFHIFAGSQALSADAIIEAQQASLALAALLSEAAGQAPPMVNLGGGFGIPYFAGEQSLDLEPIGRSLSAALRDRGAVLIHSGFAIELGRWLVGEAGVYLTRIVDRKLSHGKVFLITDGGMHHQLAASGNFGQVVRRNYPVAIANRLDQPANEAASIVGCLCTPLDRLADDVILPAAKAGDLVALFQAGAYGLSASPQAFLSQQPAREILVSTGN